MRHFVYILFSHKAKKYYIGQTSDILARVYQHNHPEDFSKFSAKATPWSLKAFFQISDSRGQAILVEKFIRQPKNTL